MNRYVVITPAHNEQQFIERTLRSMVAQTVRPQKWVIVDDGSTDATAQVVARYAAQFSFIELVRKTRDPERNFARKVLAFNRGLEAMHGVAFDFIGNVDADMSFEADYFERILKTFEEDPHLGISGGIVYTKFTREFKTYDHTLDSVGGKVQIFRRQCFDDVAGYRPLKFGGIDATAEIMARMQGWTVRKSLTTPAYEHRPTGFAYGNPIAAKMCEGRRFYSLGYDPVFYLLRCLYRVTEYPFVLGSGAAWLRYVYAMVRRETLALPSDVVTYLRREQRKKILQHLHFWSPR
jgi:glycosyltransferase involved in cell wall biosynthesis